jgi:hypothetical protein
MAEIRDPIDSSAPPRHFAHQKEKPARHRKMRFVADALTDSVAAEIRADGLTCQDRRQGGHSAWTGRADAAN